MNTARLSARNITRSTIGLALAIGLTACGACGGSGAEDNNANNSNNSNNTTGSNNTTASNNSNNTAGTNNSNNTAGSNNSNNTAGTNNTTTSNNSNNSNNSTGAASVSFKATFGSNFPNQLPASWRAALAVQNQGDAPLVFMLCETTDPTCEDPVSAVEIATDAPVQSSFGPDVTVSDLPAGDYLAMVFLDSERSRERGFGWEETPAKTVETAWGGYASEFDIMLSPPDVGPATNANPPATPVAVTLTDGETLELGTLRMAHFHERRVDPVPVPEQGAMAVVTQNGLRMIELDTFALADAGGGFLDYFLVDGSGNDLSTKGDICGMIEGPGSTIYVLYQNAAGGAGFAVPFDTSSRQQLGNGGVIDFPGSGSPCQGAYHEGEGVSHLYAINIGASGIATGDKGMWYADLSGGLGSDGIDGVYMDRSDDDILEVGFNAIVAHEGTLYATMTPTSSDSSYVPAATVGFHTVFKAELAADGKPDFKAGGDYDFWTPMANKDGVIQPGGNVDCVTSSQSGGTTAGLTIAPFHDGKTLLFVGGCSSIAVFDVDADARFDAAPNNPRSMDIDATLFGHGYTRFSLSPAGDILYVLPQFKSQFHMYFQKDNDPNSRQTFNRYMILPLALDQGAAPAVHPDFTGDDVDGHAGATNIGNKVTPAADPGVDINIGHLTRYQVNWSGSLAGSTNQSGSIPTGPSFAAARNTIWLRGSGVSGNSGLGKGANLMSYSVAERRAHLWTHNQSGRDWDFYRVWEGGNESDAPFGYDLTPGSDAYLATYGLLYVDSAPR